MAVTALLRLAKLTGKRDLQERAEATLRCFQSLMASSPLAAGQMLVALDFYLGPVEEFAVVGDPGAEAMLQVLRAIRRGFRPNKVTALTSSAKGAKPITELLPLLSDKPANGPVTTYICKDFTCQAPLVGVEALENALKE